MALEFFVFGVITSCICISREPAKVPERTNASGYVFETDPFDCVVEDRPRVLIGRRALRLDFDDNLDRSVGDIAFGR